MTHNKTGGREESEGRERSPEVAGTMSDDSGCDVIALDYPNWRSDLPMICYSFSVKVKLEERPQRLSAPTRAAAFRAPASLSAARAGLLFCLYLIK